MSGLQFARKSCDCSCYFKSFYKSAVYQRASGAFLKLLVEVNTNKLLCGQLKMKKQNFDHSGKAYVGHNSLNFLVLILLKMRICSDGSWSSFPLPN